MLNAKQSEMDLYEYVPMEDARSPAHHGIGIVLKSISLMVIICAGAIENAVIIYAVVRDRRLHKAPYYFVINLAIADLLRSVICLPFVQATVIHGSQWQYGSSACKLLAFASTFFIFGAAFALLVLAIDRYLSVIYHVFHSRKLRGLMCLSTVLLGWGVSFILSFPPVFGLGTYDFNPLEEQCTSEHRHYTNNDTMGFVAIFLATISLTLFLYGRILYFLRKHRRMKPVLCNPPRSQNWNFCRATQPLAMGLAANNPAVPPGAGGAALGVGAVPTALQGLPVPTGYVAQAPQAQQGNYIPMQQIPVQQIGFNQPTTPPQVNIASNTNFTTCVFSPESLRPIAKERLTRAVFMMTVTYDLIWLPYVIATCYYLFTDQRSMSRDFITVATWLTYCQVALLPLVYIICHRPVRRHVLGSSSMDNSEQMDSTTQPVSIDA